MAPTPKIPSLDGLRAVSILLVILGHVSSTVMLPSYFYRYFHIQFWGELGVTIFFVISGFLITTLLVNEKISHNGKIDIKKFYQRRLLRILPVCYLYILIVFILNKILNFNIPNACFWHAITYTMNFYAIPYTVNFSWFLGAWPLTHLWSLAVEEQFYLFWPWVTKLTLKRITSAALIIIACAPISRVIVQSRSMSHLSPKWKILTLAPFSCFADCLMIGCLLAISQYTHPHLWRSSVLKNRFVFLLVIFIMLYTSFLSAHGQAAIIALPFGKTIISSCIAYIIARAITIRNNMTFKCLNHPLMVYVGALSYSIYVWQQLFLFPKDQLNGPAYWFQIFPTNILLVFCVSIMSYHLWEKNFLRIKEKFKAT